MKYFCENAPEYHIACAGSLLGIALAKPSSFPVGKVDFMQIDPMTFSEFLVANGDENLAKYMESVDTIEPIPDAFFHPLYEKLKMYYVTGGMPEPVLMWTQNRDTGAMQHSLSGIIDAYERDFAKHPDTKKFPKISMVWKSIPSQLARENKKFIYKVVKPGARAREYEDALQWLVDARLVHKVYRSSARDFRSQLTMTCQPLRFIWWMSGCCAGFPSSHLPFSVKETGFLRNSRGH